MSRVAPFGFRILVEELLEITLNQCSSVLHQELQVRQDVLPGPFVFCSLKEKPGLTADMRNHHIPLHNAMVNPQVMHIFAMLEYQAGQATMISTTLVWEFLEQAAI